MIYIDEKLINDLEISSKLKINNNEKNKVLNGLDNMCKLISCLENI